MAAGMMHSRSGFAEDLWLYGEDELALAMLDTDDATYRRIMDVAGSPDVLEHDPRQAWSVSEMAALAAVQVLTGRARYAKRKRRRAESTLDDFWRGVGRPRPDTNLSEAEIRLYLGLP